MMRRSPYPQQPKEVSGGAKDQVRRWRLGGLSLLGTVLKAAGQLLSPSSRPSVSGLAGAC